MLHGSCRRLALFAGLLLWAGAATSVSAQLPTSITHEGIQTRSYDFEEAGVEMEYELFVPTSYDASEATPLIVVLHGLGSSAQRVIRYEALTDLAEERGYIVVAPEGYNSRGWYGSRGPGRASTRDEAANDPENLGELSEMDVMNVLEITRRELNIDPDRIYLMGHSMGGGGTWYLGMKYSDLWAALGPVAPAIYTDPGDLAEHTHLPVIVLQGTDDELVSVERTREWVSTMEALGMDHRYLEIPDGGHSALITRSPENMREFFDFFDTRSR